MTVCISASEPRGRYALLVILSNISKLHVPVSGVSLPRRLIYMWSRQRNSLILILILTYKVGNK